MHQHSGITVVRTFENFDLWLGLAVRGQSKRHQLWLGRPGKGKTARLHRHVQNTVGADLFPRSGGRVQAPIYSGRITPAKFFIRGWQHHLEPLLCLNDIYIKRLDPDWEALLVQLLEAAGRRTIRWDLKSKAALESEDWRDILRYLRQRGLLDQFLQEQRERAAEEDEEDLGSGHRLGRSPFQESLPELDTFERTYGDDEDREEAFNSITKKGQDDLRLPRAYDTESTAIMIANSLGDEGWERLFSRLRVFVWDPLIEEQIADLRSWDPPVPGAILGVIQSCHRKGEVLNLDYRAILNAAEDLRLGMPWEDSLRDSFCTPTDQQVQEDACNILDCLVGEGAKVGQTFTERDLYQRVSSLRGKKYPTRRSAALDHLVNHGWIERFRPPAVLRPGVKGRRPGPSFRVLHLPED